jgi:hypothetical protein
MAGTIIADYIRTDANKLSLNVGNTTFATINAGGFYSNTGVQIISAVGTINAASITSGTVGTLQLADNAVTSTKIASIANTVVTTSLGYTPVNPTYAQLNRLGTFSINADGFTAITFEEMPVASGISYSGANITFSRTGIYLITAGFRFGTGGDIWTACRLYGDGATKGYGYGTGNAVNDAGPVSWQFLANITNTTTTYQIQVGRLGGGLNSADPVIGDAASFAATISKVA